MSQAASVLAGAWVLSQVLLCTCHLSTQDYMTTPDVRNGGGTTAKPVSDHRFFLHEIFSKYGHNGQMTFEGFEHLLESLGLGNIIINDHDVKAHQDAEFKNMHGTHNHSKKADLPEKDVTTSGRQGNGHSHTHPTAAASTSPSPSLRSPHHSHDNNPSDGHTTEHHHHHEHHAPSPATPLGDHHTPPPPNPSDSIYRYSLREAKSPELLINISTLVDQHREMDRASANIVLEQCLSPRDILEAFGINQSSSLNPVSFLHLCPAIIYELDQGHCLFRNQHIREERTITTLDQWVYSTIAIVVISLCGLLSVAVIPIMQKWFYQTLLQFFVGLAVGSLSGDALLHLMPHAMLGGEGSHSHDDSTTPFVDTEKMAVWRGFVALGGIFFFFIAERLLGTYATHRRKKREAKLAEPRAAEGDHSGILGHVGEKLSQYKKSSYEFEKNGKEMIKNQREVLSADAFSSRKNSLTSYKRSSGFDLPTPPPAPPADYTVTVHDHSHSELKNGHGHGHSHAHEVPQTVTAVAWMVIMGDGLHNFCDGLAIGAAFASGIEGGISTAVAVFCHELPHELGDFAMLLKTGMSVKQALFYNAISSVLCFVGMVIGVSLGNVESSTSWIFAATAGMFLYIALVDMLPELTNFQDSSSTATYQLAVQALGISFGISIMLLIANYEQELQNIIS